LAPGSAIGVEGHVTEGGYCTDNFTSAVHTVCAVYVQVHLMNRLHIDNCTSTYKYVYFTQNVNNGSVLPQ
jgi:hypothetical protein